MAQPEMEGRLQFYIGTNVTAATLSEWSPEKMTKFFMGIAKIIHAADDRNWPKVKYSARREGLIPISIAEQGEE